MQIIKNKKNHNKVAYLKACCSLSITGRRYLMLVVAHPLHCSSLVAPIACSSSRFLFPSLATCCASQLQHSVLVFLDDRVAHRSRHRLLALLIGCCSHHWQLMLLAACVIARCFCRWPLVLLAACVAGGLTLIAAPPSSITTKWVFEIQMLLLWVMVRHE